MAQQLFCVTSLTFNSYEIMSRTLERLEHIEEKMASLQGPETELINPDANQPQQTSGGENRLSE